MDPEPKDMKVLIAGMAKSGTSILTYRIAGALADPCQINFEPSYLGRGKEENIALHRGLCEVPGNVITKALIDPDDDAVVERFFDCASHYDKKILLLRDPRDREISSLLYRNYWGHIPAQEPQRTHFLKDYNRLLCNVIQKEREPSSIPFSSLNGPARRNPRRIATYAYMQAVLKELDGSWLKFHYEDLVDGKYELLDRYLGVSVASITEVPETLCRVVRSKRYGNWRDWFLKEDVDFYKPLYSDYLRLAGYDADDWRLNDNPTLDPELGSAYIKKLHTDHNL